MLGNEVGTCLRFANQFLICSLLGCFVFSMITFLYQHLDLIHLVSCPSSVCSESTSNFDRPITFGNLVCSKLMKQGHLSEHRSGTFHDSPASPQHINQQDIPKPACLRAVIGIGCSQVCSADSDYQNYALIYRLLPQSMMLSYFHFHC
jgi:hypothetical protein